MNVEERQQTRDIFTALIQAWVASGKSLSNKEVEGFAQMAVDYVHMFAKVTQGKL